MNTIYWQQPFNTSLGSGIVYRLFRVSGLAFAVGFQPVRHLSELKNKGFNLTSGQGEWLTPNAEIWQVAFDRTDPAGSQFGFYQHVLLPGLASGRVLINVARTIKEHYIQSHADAYVFCAARDCDNCRQLDLVELYDNLLGLGTRRTTPIITLPGMRCYNGLGYQERGYVVTLHNP